MQDHLYAHILVLSGDERSDVEFPARLEELGHRVHPVAGIGTALRDLLELDIDVLVLDPGLSVDEDDLAVIERLHERGPTGWIPIAVLLPERERWLRTCAWRAGADDVIDPAVRSDEIDARIQRLVRTGRRQRRMVARFQRMRSLTDQLNDALVVMDGTGRAEVFNEGICRMLDLDPDILRERSLTKILSVMGVPRDTIERVLTTDGVIDEDLSVSIGGIERAVEMRCARLPIAADGRPALGAVLRDVTEQRDQERVQADFHSMIAHDLRSPISVIQGYLQLLDGDDPGVPIDEIVERIKEKVEDVSRLLHDFLDFSMLDAGFLRLEPAPLDLSALLAEMERDVEMLARDRDVNVSIEVDPDAAGVEVEGDAHRLRQVLQNLVSNALKYGGENGDVEIHATANARGVRVSVRDHGPGVAAEDQELIFERYQRARRDRGDGKGIGLGLMIVRRIVEGHGGTVGVESRPGDGATFWFEIPPVGVQGRVATVIPTY